MSRQLGRRIKAIDARCQGEPSQVLTGQIEIAPLTGQRIVSNRDIALRLCCDRIPGVDRAGRHDDPWGKASD